MRPLLVLIALLILVLVVTSGVTWLVQQRHAADPRVPALIQTGVSDAAPPSLPTAAPALATAPRSTGRIRFRPVLRNRELQILESPYFTIGYDNQRKNPAWVSYDLDGPITHLGSEPNRPATFATDMRTSAHVSQRDYSSSGFDRGHMCPAYAMFSRYGSEAFLATFICSNIVPQPHSVNAGIWEELEVGIAGRGGHGDGWAGKYGRLTVINGPVYGADPGHLRVGVTIPEACFSIVIDQGSASVRAIAFEIPNLEGTRGPLTRWITTIRKIEDDTGLDLFAGEATSERAALETSRADRLW